MPQPTTEESFALKAKGMLGEIANYLWANITGERERDFSMSDIETPSAWIDKSDPEYTPSIYSEPRSYLRGELPDVRKVGVAAYAKAKLKQGVVRQMTTKNPRTNKWIKGYNFGAETRTPSDVFGGIPGALPVKGDEYWKAKRLEDTTQAVLRAIDKLPDDEFRQLEKIEMLNKAEYAKEVADIGMDFKGFYRHRKSTGTGKIAISYGESSKDITSTLVHETVHGRVAQGTARPMIGTLDPTDIQKGNKPLSFEDKQLYKRLELRSQWDVPYSFRPTEKHANIVANIVKALPSKMFKGGKVPQSVYDGIVRASAKAALMEAKTVSSAASIKGTKGWKFIPEGSKSPFIMTKGTKGSETKIAEKMDSAGNMYYEIYLDELKLPDKFTDLESVVKEANSYTDIIGFGEGLDETQFSRSMGRETKAIAKTLEPGEMTKEVFDAKYGDFPDYPFDVTKKRGQRAQLEFIKSITHDPDDKVIVDEVLSMMDKGVFSHEDAVQYYESGGRFKTKRVTSTKSLLPWNMKKIE